MKAITPLLKKLNFKQPQEVLIMNAPQEFESELTAFKQHCRVQTDSNNCTEIEFVLTFIKNEKEINAITPLLAKKLKGDGIVWFAYPKKTFKNYCSEINRDRGWEILENHDFEAVRQVAIDADWSALWFRKVAFIKTMKRKTSFAMTEKGKLKTKH